MIICYILFSTSFDKYYVGFTQDNLMSRLEKHNTSFYENTFTKITSDWEVFLVINCETITQAIQIEKHIKRMKSRVYIENLSRYPEMTEKLLKKYL